MERRREGETESDGRVKALVLRCAGTNCDGETAAALEKAGASAERVHVNSLIRGERRLSEFDMMVVPGGFSYGDDIASGKVLANQLSNHIKAPIREFLEKKKPILGICNGFQVLVKCGLLPGTEGWDDVLRATLSDNDSGKFECRWTFLKVQSTRCPFVKGLPKVFSLPVAHGEGKFVPESAAFFRSLEKNGQVVFRYVNSQGKSAGYPWNPAGSYGDVAGICNPAGNVLGLMPHPERYAFPHQHSHWTRCKPLPEQGVGLQIFKNAVRYAAQLKN
jgi:phosphoribosylformylglycinamidine synthase subunit PurQ / glutaminase